MRDTPSATADSDEAARRRKNAAAVARYRARQREGAELPDDFS